MSFTHVTSIVAKEVLITDVMGMSAIIPMFLLKV